MPAGWETLVERSRAVLRAVAAAGTTISYGEFRRRTGADLPDRGERDLAALLRAASEAEERAGVGLISAVVVGRSGRPGQGWYRLAADHGRPVSADPDGAWRAERERLRARTAGG